MGKAVVTGWVESDAKDGIVAAIRPVLGAGGSITNMLQEFGAALAAELEKRGGAANMAEGGFDLAISLQPKKKRAASG